MPQTIAILERNDRTIRRAVTVPEGLSIEFDADAATRQWLHKELAGEWHLVEFLPLTELKQ